MNAQGFSALPRTWIVYSFFLAGLLLFSGLSIVENEQAQQIEANRFSYMAYTANKRFHDLSRPLMAGESEFLYEVHDVAGTLARRIEKGENATLEFVELKQSGDELIKKADENGYPYEDFGYVSSIGAHAYVQHDQICLDEDLVLLISAWQPDAANLNVQWILKGGWLGIALFCLLLWMETVGAEVESGTAKTVFTSSTPRKIIFKGKAVFSLCIPLVLNLTVYLVLGAAGLIHGSGTFMYPYIVDDHIMRGIWILVSGWTLCACAMTGLFLWVFSWHLKTMDAFCVCLLAVAVLFGAQAWNVSVVLTSRTWILGIAGLALTGVLLMFAALHILERKELG
ncbi:MAG TPA: hypothetical protein DCP49_10300 [Erysipelotrichaceae bacterium]|nr:hypothetical protein [Erysipelotrichaceae bacterium]